MVIFACPALPVECRDRVGQKVGKAVVDRFGDKVMAANLHEDTWRIRHDAVKAEINRLCFWSHLPATCEVFGLFSHLIPQEGLSRIERGRKRQGMVPDFQLEVPSPTGGRVSRLAELKDINCCPTRYPPGAVTKLWTGEHTFYRENIEGRLGKLTTSLLEQKRGV